MDSDVEVLISALDHACVPSMTQPLNEALEAARRSYDIHMGQAETDKALIELIEQAIAMDGSPKVVVRRRSFSKERRITRRDSTRTARAVLDESEIWTNESLRSRLRQEGVRLDPKQIANVLSYLCSQKEIEHIGPKTWRVIKPEADSAPEEDDGMLEE